ncbi:MAG TPA: NAD-dependent epimerase, partial [Gammaproteobacteria bacterium]|nr:NAD-dependent epimerase [Gammaproteobacteria bacterium]
DFTYIEDIIDGLLKVLENPPQKDNQWCADKPNPATSYAPYRLYNIGNNHPIDLMDFVRAIEKATRKVAKINFMPMQNGDVVATHADISHLEKDFCYTPKTSIQEGIEKFVEWYRDYYVGAGGET